MPVVLQLAGLAAVVYGIAQVSTSAAWIVAGVFAVVVGEAAGEVHLQLVHRWRGWWAKPDEEGT